MPVLKYKDGNEWKVVSKNVAYEKDNTLFKSMVDRSITEIKAEDLDGITSIEQEAFDWCDKLTSIELPDSIITIMKYAFANCYSLKTITIPKNVVSIRDRAFSGCRELVSIYLLNKDTTVDLSGDQIFLN